MDNIRHLIATVLLQASKELPAVKEMLKQAEAVLGYDLLQLCQEGPKEKLDDTVYSQPALFVAGLAAVEKLRQDNAQAVDNCSATAGKSCCKACMTGLSAAACWLVFLPLVSYSSLTWTKCWWDWMAYLGIFHYNSMLCYSSAEHKSGWLDTSAACALFANKQKSNDMHLSGSHMP